MAAVVETSRETSLVVQTSFIGDVVLTTPLITRLAQRSAVDVVTTPAGAAVLANHPHVRELIVYDKRHHDRGVTGWLRLANRLRQRAGRSAGRAHAPRRAYLAQGSVRSAALVAAAGYDTRIGFTTSAGRRFYTQRMEYRDDWHHARRLLSLGDPTFAANASETEIRPSLAPTAADLAAVDALLRHREHGEHAQPGMHSPMHSPTPPRTLIALAPGSAWATKQWPYYGELCRLLVANFDVVVIGAAGDAESVPEAAADERVIDATGRLSLLGSAAMIGRAAALVTNDSAPQHLASAMGTPTVTLFGPTVPDFGFGPLAPHSRVVGHQDLPCRPCDRHGPQRCPLGHWRCMRDVRTHDVYETVINVILQGATR